MKILCLYHNPRALELFRWIKGQGNQVILHTERLEPGWCGEQAFDLTISYTYRYILSGEILDALGGNVVNLHNSFLPFNRGADPNIWSILEGTPRGVTLHYMTAGLDKGSIIAQRLVGACGPEATLASSYEVYGCLCLVWILGRDEKRTAGEGELSFRKGWQLFKGTDRYL